MCFICKVLFPLTLEAFFIDLLKEAWLKRMERYPFSPSPISLTWRVGIKEWAINRGFWNNAFKRLKPTRKVGICVADAITYVIGRSDKGVIVDMEDFTKRYYL